MPPVLFYGKRLSMSDTITYMGYEWITVEDGVVTIGITEDGAADLADDISLSLPEESDSVLPGKVCGEIESGAGVLNLYCPVAGTVLEINEAVLENPQILLEDPQDEGWLFKVEADDPDKIDLVSIRRHATGDDDEDDVDDDDDDDYDDDYEDEDKD